MKTTYIQNQLINNVVAKLQAEGMTKNTFSYQQAKEILSKCVAPNACLKVLFNFDREILELL